jgi:hypothetical protein
MTMTDVNLPRLSRLELAIVRAAESLGGGGSTEAIRDKAVRMTGEVGPYGAEAHYAKAFYDLEKRGVLVMALESYRSWWLADYVWKALGHEEPIVRPQEGLF